MTMSSNDYLEAIKKRLFWIGFIQRSDIEQLCALGPTQSSALINALKTLCGKALRKQGHRYFLKEPSQFEYSSQDFLKELLLSPYQAHPCFMHANRQPFIDPLLFKGASPTVIKELLRALELNKGVAIDYVGANPGDTAQRRIIDPIRFVFISGRWHVHAYCRRRDAGRDFVLSRILNSDGICEREHAELAWSIREMDKNVTIQVVPHPDLTADQRLAVQREYNFDGEVSKAIILKKHQLYYFRKRYLADDGEGPPDKFLVER